MTKRRAAKSEATERAARLDELLAATPVAAGGSMPEDLCRQVRALAGDVRYGQTRERTDVQAVQRETARVAAPASFRPEWLAHTFVPRLLPATAAYRIPRYTDNLRMRIPPLPIHLLRAELIDETWPWCTVGKVYAGSDAMGNWTGSGVLVGPNLLLTASHVVPWDGDRWYMRFIPAYTDRNPPPGQTYRAPFGESYVSDVHGYRNTDDVTGIDYSVCKLYTRVGDAAGWMGSRSSTDDDFYEDGSWTSVGYPGDFFGGHRPAVEYGVGVDDVDNEGEGREIETRVYTTGGWSGGPLWGWIDGDAKVIAVLSGEEKDFLDPTRDVYAGGSPMVNLVKWGHANWP